MVRTCILADDLSGAAELAGLAFRHGLTAEVHRHPDTSSAAETIAIDSASRQLAPDVAANRLRAVTRSLGDFAGALLYKKVDSLLRGNVRAEIEAVMHAGGYRRAVLVPANPSRGRIILGGQYLIDGQPLDQSSLAADPYHPRTTASVAALLGDGTQPLHLPTRGQALPGEGIIVPEVATHEDLQHLARKVDANTLPAGAADFFAALLEIRVNQSHPSDTCPLSGLLKTPALLVCGSRISWPARRAAALAAKVPVAEVEMGFFTMDVSRSCALGFGDRTVSPQMALEILSSMAEQILRRARIQTLLVEGGDTAAALAERMGWTRFTIEAAAPGGVGVLRPFGDSAPLELIKPGSYAWPEEIWNAFVACAS